MAQCAGAFGGVSTTSLNTAVLLAAGLGSRLWPITRDLPKCLVPVRGEALLDIWIEQLCAAGISRLLINTHYFAEQVRQHVARRAYPARIELFHEERLLGTAGTLRALGPKLQGETFLCAHADNLTWFDLAAFHARHLNRPESVAITMLTFDTDRPEHCGIVQEDEAGIVRAFFEKSANPPGRRANGAIYLMEPDVLEAIEKMTAPTLDLSIDVVPHYLGRIQTWWSPDTYLRDIGTPESLACGNAEWAEVRRHQRAAA